MITMRGLSRAIVDAVSSDTTFLALTNSLVGSTFEYYVNVDLTELTDGVALPYFSIVTFTDQDDIEIKKFFKTQILLGIERQKPVRVNNITEEPSLDILEQLSRKALDVIKSEIRTFGVQGDTNIRISFVNFYVPKPDGEVDLQMQIDLEFNQDKFLAC